MSQLWFAPTREQRFVSLGLPEFFDEANCAPGNTVWILDEEIAFEWRNSLDNIASRCAQFANSWSCVDYTDHIRYVGEFRTIEAADQALKFECVQLLHRDTALSWIHQLLLLMKDATRNCA